MAAGDGYKVDVRDILRVMQDYLNKGTKKQYVQAMNRVSNITVKQTRANLRSAFKGGKNLQKAVVRRTNSKSLENIYTKIHIMGEYSKGKEEKGFVAKFFEMGTVQRKTRGRMGRKRNVKNRKYSSKTDLNRGETKAHWFFKRAIDSTRNAVENELLNEIQKIIHGIWNK
jgi:hypothetical protein